MDTKQNVADAVQSTTAPATASRGRHDFSPADVYRRHFSGRSRQERMFIGSLGFFAGFGVARAITHAIRARGGPFHNLSAGARHLHHMVFGIGGLLGIGYLWLMPSRPPIPNTMWCRCRPPTDRLWNGPTRARIA